MQWTSVSEFFAMGGHGFFVWCAYGMAAFVVLCEGVGLVLGGRAAKDAVRKQVRKQAARGRTTQSSTR